MRVHPLPTILVLSTLLGSATLAHSEDPVLLRTRSVEIPVETEASGAAAIEGTMLWVTRDGGLTWNVEPEIFREKGAVRFEAPEDGVYGFSLVARDRAGRIQEPPQPGDLPDVSCVIDTTPPQLDVFTPAGGDRLYAGSHVEIRWQVSDVALPEGPVTIFARRSPDHPWSPVLAAQRFETDGRVQWWPPYVDGSFQLQVVAEDLVGNTTRWTSERPIEIVPFDAFRESSVLAARTTTNFHRFPVFYRSPEHRPDETAQVEIWVRRGFGAWEARHDPDRRSPYHFRAVEEGEHELYLRTIDHNGEEDRPAPGPDSPADLRILVDTLPPLLALEIEDGSPVRVHPGGEPLHLHWSIEEDDPHPRGARIEASIDGGQRWIILEEIPPSVVDGEVTWIPPMIETDELELRIVARDRAGNRARRHAATRLRLLNPKADPADFVRRHHDRALVLASRADRRSLERAREELGLVLQVAEENSAAWHDLGVIDTRLGAHSTALAAYVQALDLQPGDLRHTFSVVEGHLNLHRVGADGDETHLEAARTRFRSISRVKLYEDEDFRALLERYRLIKEALE